MMRTLEPVAIVPENTRPKAKKRPESDAGIILEMYTISGPYARLHENKVQIQQVTTKKVQPQLHDLLHLRKSPTLP